MDEKIQSVSDSSTRIVQAFNDAFNRHDVAGMTALMSDDCRFENTHPSPDGTIYAGKPTVTKFWQDFFRESPNAQIEIEEIFSLDNRCVMRWRFSWGYASGAKGHVRGVDIFKLRGGVISEKLSYVKG